MQKRKPRKRTRPQVKKTLNKGQLINQISLDAVRFFKSLSKEYDANRASGKLTAEEATHGQIGEMTVFIAKNLPIDKNTRSKAVRLLTIDGRAMLLNVKAVHRIPFSKKEFIDTIDHALEVLPQVKEELIREVPHGKEIVEGLAGIKTKLLAAPRKDVTGGAGILHDISLINILELRRILGTDAFLMFHDIQTNCVHGIVK